ncbi:MAG: DUF368 domain-containing protein [Verrucomicrobiales bacterium]|nr:DUF368 domain-containing protein [Verrucomicrobiales bacterium]
MKEGIGVFFKGAAMGAANVIPGVSGGTVAFITGIYERLIHAVKSVDATALKLLLSGKFADFAKRIDFSFLAALGAGIVVSILTLASVLKFLFANHEVFVWAFFFGLILASVYFVGKKVKHWSAGAAIGFLLGAGIAIGVALLKPASENDSIWYLLICGVVAMASMIIPGLSGSFVLLLLGNYQLIMIESVAGLKTLEVDAFRILIPVGIGAIVGVIALSRLLAWIFDRYHDLAVALLTGFVAGSLLIIWPWKTAQIEVFEAAGRMKEKVIGYQWYLPEMSGETFLALGIMVLGFLSVWLMERLGTVESDDDSAK